MVENGSPIVVLTGAGLSKESGLDTFRDPDGIWSRYRIEDVATPDAFARDPVKVLDFYNFRRRNLQRPDIAPNAAHRALARLEAEWPGDVLIVTQNVDDLHERAGSQALIHMHGELLKARCLDCGSVVAWRDDLDTTTECGDCRRAGRMRPHVVWFGEMPLDMPSIHQALEQAGLFVSIGTSGQVYPAADFVHAARVAGARTLELNLEPSAGAHLFHQSAYGPATDIVPRFVDRLLGAGA